MLPSPVTSLQHIFYLQSLSEKRIKICQISYTMMHSVYVSTIEYFIIWTVNVEYLYFHRFFIKKRSLNIMENFYPKSHFLIISRMLAFNLFKIHFFAVAHRFFIELKSSSKYGLKLSKNTLFTAWQQLFTKKKNTFYHQKVRKILTVSLKWIKNIFLMISNMGKK